METEPGQNWDSTLTLCIPARLLSAVMCRVMFRKMQPLEAVVTWNSVLTSGFSSLALLKPRPSVVDVDWSETLRLIIVIIVANPHNPPHTHIYT